jgi:hypothetical protein
MVVIGANMITTTHNGLTYIEGHILQVPALIRCANREQARKALDGETRRIYLSKGYTLPSYDWLNVEVVV